jgi:hypothetical protein
MSGQHARSQAARDAAVLLRTGCAPESVLGTLQAAAEGSGAGLTAALPGEEADSCA